MKKMVVVLVLLLIALSVSACLPTEPKDIAQYCQESYELCLAEDPDCPHAYVGACTSYLITGKTSALKAMCGYEPFWAELSPEVNSRQECIKFLNENEVE